ncbi:Serine protease DegP [Trichinella pseudospiralis]
MEGEIERQKFEKLSNHATRTELKKKSIIQKKIGSSLALVIVVSLLQKHVCKQADDFFLRILSMQFMFSLQAEEMSVECVADCGGRNLHAL